MPTEREEIDEKIARHREKVAEKLAEMGVKPDAAKRAVAAELKYGLSRSNTLHVSVAGRVRGAHGAEVDCAATIRNSLPETAFVAFDEQTAEERTWASFEGRLAATSRHYSRAELREQAEEAELERILNPVERGEPTAREIQLRAEVSGDF